MANLMDELNSMNALWDFRLQLEHAMKGQALLESIWSRFTNGYYFECSKCGNITPEEEREMIQKLQEHFGFDDSE